MDNYFRSFCLLTHVGFNDIRTTGALNKKRLRKCTITRDKPLQKKNVTTLNNTHQAKKQLKFCIPIYWVECSINDLKQQDLYFDILGWV